MTLNWKLDVPQDATRETQWRITHTSRQSYFQAQMESPTLSSTLADSVIKVGVDLETVEKDSDIYAIQVDKVVSVTPISLDYTSRTDLSKLHEFIDELDEVQ